MKYQVVSSIHNHQELDWYKYEPIYFFQNSINYFIRSYQQQATSHDFLGPRSSNSCLLGAFGSKCASAPWPPSGHRPSLVACGIHRVRPWGGPKMWKIKSPILTNRSIDILEMMVFVFGSLNSEKIGGCAHPYLKHHRVAMFQHSHLLGRGRDAKIQHGIRQGTWDDPRIVAANDLS